MNKDAAFRVSTGKRLLARNPHPESAMVLKSIAVIPTSKAGGRKRPSPTIGEDDVGPLSIALMRNPATRTKPQLVHRFHSGERLRLANGGYTVARVESFCKVLAALPYEGRGALLYRIRSEREAFDRVVGEGDLSR